MLAGDFRAATGTQTFVKDAAMNLVYVSEFSKTDGTASSEAEMYTAADVGFIAQNVYLYCASEGLGAVVRASIDKPALAKTLKLQANQKIILAQSVGHPIFLGDARDRLADQRGDRDDLGYCARPAPPPSGRSCR